MRRRLGVARRLCWTVAAGVIIAGGLLALDAWWWLAGWQRALALSAWLTGMIVLVWWSGLAAVQAWESSPQKERAIRSRERLANLIAVVAAALALSALVLTLLGWPEAPLHARRVFLPWSEALRPVQYRIVVTSGDAAIPVGERVTVSAYVERLSSAAPWPPQAWLIRQALPRGLPERLPMQGDETGSVYTSLRVEGDFRYRIEAGTATSDWYNVVRIEPVRLARESVLRVEPPSYAVHLSPRQYAIPEEETEGLRVLAWQYGAVQLQVVFTRPVATAYLEWRAEEASTVEILPLLLDGEHREGTVRWTVARGGRWKLVAVVERQGRRWYCQWPGVVEVQSDLPPRWLEVSGLMAAPRRLAPGSVLPIRFRVQDDFGIAQVWLEVVRVNNPWPQQISLSLTTRPEGTVEGQYDWPIDAQIRDGEILRLRLRVRDNRRVEHPPLGQQESVFPPEGWCEVHVDRTAPPQALQDILAQHLWLREAIAAVRKYCQDSRQTLLHIQRETPTPSWQDHHRTLLRQTAEQYQEVRRVWDRVLLHLRVQSELRPLLQDARRTLEELDQLGRVAERWPFLLASAEQHESLQHALRRLQTLEHHLHQLEQISDRLAEARQQSWQLQQLAQQLEGVARQAELARSPEERAQIPILWDHWQRDWQHWLESTPAVRDVWERSVAQELQRLHQRGQELLLALERLEATEALAFHTAGQLFRLSQMEWARSILRQAEALDQKRADQPPLKSLPPARLDFFRQVLTHLERGEWLPALTVLEQGAEEANRLAREWQEAAPELAHQWRQLASRCQHQRTVLADHKQQILAYLAGPLQESVPVLARRVERCAEAAALLLTPDRLASCPAMTGWFLGELRAAAEALQEGRWTQAQTALHHAAAWLFLLETVKRPGEEASGRLPWRSLQDELQTLMRLVQRYGDSPALILSQSRWALRQRLLQLQDWDQQWQTLLTSTPSALLPTAAIPSPAERQRWRQAWYDLDQTLMRERVQSSVSPLASLPAYQAAYRLGQQAVETLASALPKVPPAPQPEDPSLVTTIAKLRQVQSLVSESLMSAPSQAPRDGQEQVARFRRFAQLLHEAAILRLTLPPVDESQPGKETPFPKLPPSP
ncbi:hypothetical protein [Thermogemmata fonticola]|uniref:DUF4175 family protein n=1 Tax=Thermogemmata fonticola TaxID=2755323 RepID=A0A7V8VCV9_9BACT|nr:hypothetical protein [Thermogemmata fonticola]MBA2225447.1 hypothetical protein [Thermogemmata fonticola]